jgi:hypothetical protein
MTLSVFSHYLAKPLAIDYALGLFNFSNLLMTSRDPAELLTGAQGLLSAGEAGRFRPLRVGQSVEALQDA